MPKPPMRIRLTQNKDLKGLIHLHFICQNIRLRDKFFEIVVFSKKKSIWISEKQYTDNKGLRMRLTGEEIKYLLNRTEGIY